MARKTKIDRLPPELRDLIGRLREAGKTNAEIRAALQELDVHIARSTLGDHLRQLDAIGEEIRRGRQVAEALIARLGGAAGAGLAGWNVELVQAAIMRLMTAAAGREVEIEPREMALIADALAKLARAGKDDVDRELAVRQAVTSEAAEVAGEVARREGLSAEAIAGLRAAILGTLPQDQAVTALSGDGAFCSSGLKRGSKAVWGRAGRRHGRRAVAG